VLSSLIFVVSNDGGKSVHESLGTGFSGRC
jgi:hypothetical protein